MADKNREVKFRAWDIDGQVWLEEDEFYVFSSGVVSAWSGDDDVKNVRLSQFTGLKDKNGKEIYEGDIIKPVEMHDSNVDVWGKSREIKWFWNGWNVPSDIPFWEVIGNIYENPELLGGLK